MYDAYKPTNNEHAFIDASGRVWIEFHRNRSMYIVDTNGSKGPNKFGKDRFRFAFYNYDARYEDNLNPAKPVRILPSPFQDITEANASCNFPPCYYKSWLLE